MATPIDLQCNRWVFDAPEPRDWHAEGVPLPGIPPWWISVQQLSAQSWERLAAVLGASQVAQILAGHGFVVHPGPFGGPRGYNGLGLHYALRASDRAGEGELAVLAFGEYQPGRWVADLEGVWQVDLLG